MTCVCVQEVAIMETMTFQFKFEGSKASITDVILPNKTFLLQIVKCSFKSSTENFNNCDVTVGCGSGADI